MERSLDLRVRIIDDATRGLNSIGAAMGGVGRLAGGALTVGLGAATAGVGALGGLMGIALSEAADAEAGLAQLNAVIASTGGAAGLTADEVVALSSKLSASNGLSKFSDDAVLAGNNLLLTFTNIGKDVFPAASQAAVDMAQALGGDPVSQATALGKALNDPIAGVAALGRVGVTFTEDQKAVIASLVETGDVAGAQQIILAELGKEFGGSAAAAADTFGGKMTTLKERLLGVAEGIGTSFMPLISQAVDFLSSPENMERIQRFADGLAEGIGKAITWIQTVGVPAFESAFQFVKDAFTTFQEALSGNWEDDGIIQPFHRIIGVIGQVVGAFTGEGGLSGAFAVVLPYFQTGFNTLAEWVTGTAVPFLVEKLGAFLGAIATWASGTALPAIAEYVRVMGPPFLDWIVNDVVPLVSDKLSAFMAAVGTWVQGPGMAALTVIVKDLAPPLIAWIQADAIPLLETALAAFLAAFGAWLVATGVPAMTEAVKILAPAMLSWFADYITGQANALQETLDAFGNWIVNNAHRFAAAARRIGSAIVNGIAAAIRGAASAIYNAIMSLIPDTITIAGVTVDLPGGPPAATGPNFSSPTTNSGGGFGNNLSSGLNGNSVNFGAGSIVINGASRGDVEAGVFSALQAAGLSPI